MSDVWYVYILQCRDNSYYTGITKDIDRRLTRHNSGKAAKYTRSRRPCKLAYFEKCRDEAKARKREHEIKSWRREKKQELIDRLPLSEVDDILSVNESRPSD